MRTLSFDVVWLICPFHFELRWDRFHPDRSFTRALPDPLCCSCRTKQANRNADALIISTKPLGQVYGPIESTDSGNLQDQLSGLLIPRRMTIIPIKPGDFTLSFCSFP